MNEYLINDIRKANDFLQHSFSNFERKNVKKELIKELYENNIESSLYWSIELICAGHFNDFWNIIIFFFGKFVNTSNPKLAIYINIRFESFKNIILNGYRDNELACRNNEKIRKILAEVICIICISKKNYNLKTINIKSDEEFDFLNLTNKLKAPNIDYAKLVFKNDDPKEIYIPINEFVYCIDVKCLDKKMACYWIEWLFKFESICKAKKNKIIVERRSFANVEEKFQLDYIWIIWEAIIINSKELKEFYQKLINSIFELFCIKFNNSSKKQRKFLLYYAVSVIVDKPNENIPLVTNKKIISKICENVNILYKEVKKNELAPETDYLFKDLESNKLDKTLDKLNLVNDIDII